ncbi:MAG TPA: hypothetical protein VGL86_06470 [Polyangia bacterium]|jgi:hypothetical protein
MRTLHLAIGLLTFAGCHSFEVTGPPDTRIELDLGVEITQTPPDLDCFNSACGGCSSWANFDGTPSKVGDPCLYKGVYQCMGTSLVCSATTCLTCSTGGKTPVGTVCGADGHTIVELTYSGATCSAYDLGSAIGMCNHGENDKCLSHCTGPDGNNQYHCAAVCASDDGGGTGCAHSASETCETLAGC